LPAAARFGCLRLRAVKQLRKNHLPGGKHHASEGRLLLLLLLLVLLLLVLLLLLQESKVLFPGALPLASAGVGGYMSKLAP